MLTTRAWIISSGVVAVALVVPLTLNFSVAGAHNLKPLFLINGIVFVLAASTLFTHHGHDHDPPDEYPHHLHHYSPPYSSANADYSSGFVQEEKSLSPPEIQVSPTPDKPVSPARPVRLHRTPTTPINSAFDDLPRAYLRKEKAEDTESMDDTWAKIKAEKHMKKSKTWEGEASSSWSAPPSPWSAPPSPYNVKKTGMFIERIPTWLRMKKESSIGRDDLNARVEAFIKKFQEEIRLQRLESLRRYKSKLLKRGAKR